MSEIKREPTESEDSHSTSEWSLDTSTIGEGNDVNELKLKMTVLETTVQMLQAKVQMLEVKNKDFEKKSVQEQNQKQDLQVSRFTFSKANGNHWIRSPAGGLRAINPNPQYSQGFVANQGFLISGKHFRKKGTGGTILYYYEVTHVNMPQPFPGAILVSSQFKQYSVGLSNGINPDDKILVGHIPNSYALQNGNDHFFLSQTDNDFEWPEGAIRPKWNGIGDVVGCGILLSYADDCLPIFFTLNGILMGKQIPISHPGDRLYPTVSMIATCLEANFGDDPAKPFKYDIKTCPRIIFE